MQAPGALDMAAVADNAVAGAFAAGQAAQPPPGAGGPAPTPTADPSTWGYGSHEPGFRPGWYDTPRGDHGNHLAERPYGATYAHGIGNEPPSHILPGHLREAIGAESH